MNRTIFELGEPVKSKNTGDTFIIIGIEKGVWLKLNDNSGVTHNHTDFEKVESDLQNLIDLQIEEAKAFKGKNSTRKPAVFVANLLDGTKFVGWNFQPNTVRVGDRFHFDHGVGVRRNTDAQVVWC